MIHCSWEPLALRSRTIDGNATLRMELSTLITINDRHSTPSVHQRRSCARSALRVIRVPRPRYSVCSLSLGPERGRCGGEDLDAVVETDGGRVEYQVVQRRVGRLPAVDP